MENRKRRVVVTGMGMATPYGYGTKKFWEAMLEGKSAIDNTLNHWMVNTKIFVQLFSLTSSIKFHTTSCT